MKNKASDAVGVLWRNFGVLFVSSLSIFVIAGVTVALLCGVDRILLGLLGLPPADGTAGLFLSATLVVFATLVVVSGLFIIAICGLLVVTAPFVSYRKLAKIV